MIAMLDTSEDLDICAREIGCEVEQLLTPLTRFNRQKRDQKFAIDNGAFAGFNRDAFLSLLKREDGNQNLCRFVVVPDVVASARRTLELFGFYRGSLAKWPLALAAQDGIEDLEIPWHKIEAIFIGRSTQFKMSQDAVAVIRAAQALEKWVHPSTRYAESRSTMHRTTLRRNAI